MNKMLNTQRSIKQLLSLPKENSVLFQAVLEISGDAIFVLDKVNYAIIDCNQAALKLFEATSKSELINQPSYNLFNYEPLEFSSDNFYKELNLNGEYSQEMSFKTMKKNIFWGKLTQKNIGFTGLELSILKIEKSANYLQDEEWLSEVLTVSSKYTGRQFFKEIARFLCRSFDAEYAFIARRIAGDDEKLKIFYMHGANIRTKYINRANSFVENTLRGYTSFYPNGLDELFPGDEIIKETQAGSFIGSPFFDVSQEAMGLIGVLSTKKMTEIRNSRYMLNILASRTSAEINRIRSKEILRQQTKNLAEINHMKDKVLSVVSNDLQAPLNTLLGYSGMLKNNIKEYNSKEVGSKVKVMDNSLRNLYLILENLSDWSRLQQGLVKGNLKKNNLNNIFDDIKPYIKYLSDMRNVTLINKMPSALYILADNYLARSVFKNLATYVVKNTLKRGSIYFDTELKNGVWGIKIFSNKHLADRDELEFVLHSTSQKFFVSSRDLTVPALGVFISREFMKIQKGKFDVSVTEDKLEFRMEFPKT
jgi:signal transduction histidine kinase/PAS domain-containing protein